jgi:hypothetical protein
MGSAGPSTMVNKTIPSEVNPKTKVSGSLMGVVHGLVTSPHVREIYYYSYT